MPADLNLPASATSSLHGLSEFIEVFAHHRLPKPYVGLVWFYLVGHSLMFLLCLPYFLKQIKSGRFWLVRLVNTKRGRIIVPNHLDASATLIGAYTIWDMGFCIKLLLGYYSLSVQRNLPVITCMRFVILTIIGWIFLLGFFLVKVPPNRHKTPAWLWNVGIFVIPCTVYIGTIYCLYQANLTWNDYWSSYQRLREVLDAALATNATVPTSEQIAMAQVMIGLQLHMSNEWKLWWGIPYAVFAFIFSIVILTVTLSILISHYSGLKKKADLPMQTNAFSATNRRSRLTSMTASMGIRKWIRELPPVPEERHSSLSMLSNDTGRTSPLTMDGKTGSQPSQGHRISSRNSKRSGRGFTRMAMYGLGLRPLTQDAYDDPTGGFSDSEASAGLRSLLCHTAVQGSCIFLIVMSQVGACFIMTHPVWLQPLASHADVAVWGAKWVQLSCILRMLEFYGTGLPGLALVVSILMRQMFAIGISQARKASASASVAGPTLTQRSGADFALSALGPSVSGRWDVGQRSMGLQQQQQSQFISSRPGGFEDIAERDTEVATENGSSKLGTAYDEFLATGTIKAIRDGDDAWPASGSPARYEERQVRLQGPASALGGRRAIQQPGGVAMVSEIARPRSAARDRQTYSSLSAPRPVWGASADDDSVVGASFSNAPVDRASRPVLKR